MRKNPKSQDDQTIMLLHLSLWSICIKYLPVEFQGRFAVEFQSRDGVEATMTGRGQ